MNDAPDPLERFARVDPPSTHVRRVVARSGPRTVGPAVVHPEPAAMPWRWVLPMAATALVLIAAYVQSDRASRSVALAPPPAEPGWTGKGVDVPVLPPRAYWEMSAVEEFARLRPAPPRANRPPAPEYEEIVLPGEIHEADPLVDPWSISPVTVDDIPTLAIDLVPLAVPDAVAVSPIDIRPIAVAPFDQEAP